MQTLTELNHKARTQSPFDQRGRCVLTIDLFMSALALRDPANLTTVGERLYLEIQSPRVLRATNHDPRMLTAAIEEFKRLRALLVALPWDLDMNALANVLGAQLGRHTCEARFERERTNPELMRDGQRPRIQGEILGCYLFLGACFAHGVINEMPDNAKVRRQNDWLPRIT